MSWLSEESVLLAKNWEVVQDILGSVEAFKGELTSLLLSLKTILTGKEWWRDGWVFVTAQAAQVYIANRNWHIEIEHPIWIGVEKFDIDNVFGTAPAPQLYVWVGGSHRDLGRLLSEWIAESDYEVLGEISFGANGYVIRGHVRKCLSEDELGTFDDAAREQIVGFIAHYAQALWSFDAEIRRYVASLENC